MSVYGNTSVRSDGSDHIHREKVSNQYKASVFHKRKLRVLVFLPLISCIIIIVHVFQIKFNIRITNQELPQIEIWEYLYLFTLFLPLIGWISLRKNQSNLLLVYSCTSILFSVLPLVFAIAMYTPEMIQLLSKKNEKVYLFGQLHSIIFYGFLMTNVCFNCFAIIIALKLIRAWNTKGYKGN